ncbi:hypothetical protein [Bacillus halotolerans]|uniref:hypothetical protein n=1 Tax=Bacillus halotolerans TaxID=260554 RepID=UPI002DB84C72|nr:hypothetical protein [Bacillus halotolerans]MEC1665729.1 hypothetical protein [Bacillus halotolerans]
MRFFTEYEKGYFDAEINSAQRELETLVSIRGESNECWSEDSVIVKRIRELEEFIKNNHNPDFVLRGE